MKEFCLMIIIAIVIAYIIDFLVAKIKRLYYSHTAKKVVEKVYNEDMKEIEEMNAISIQLIKELDEFDKKN